MPGLLVDGALVEPLVLGGLVLGGGGGGALEDGRQFAAKALEIGRPRIVSLDEIDPASLLVTVSAVGSPGAADRFVAPGDFIEAAGLLRAELGASEPIAGFISSENGAVGSVNGLLQSAALGLPLVDAPCNGRAHPTGVMGSMALNRLAGYISRQAAVGGNPAATRRVKMYVAAPPGPADVLIRQAAVEAGGLIAVARNPVPAAYVREHGAPGALADAIAIGRIVERERARGGRAVAEALASALGGAIAGAGRVTAVDRRTEGGYDVGRVVVGELELTFWNEYMTAERLARRPASAKATAARRSFSEGGSLGEGGRGERLATFPDLVTTIAEGEGVPVGSSEIQPGRLVIVLLVPQARLKLGAGVRDAENLKAVEEAIGRRIVTA